MLAAKIKNLIIQGEGLRLEFKECKHGLSKNVYETVCAFLNRSGGELLLGVNDEGIITGIEPDSINRFKSDFVTAMNNPQKISPSYYLSVDAVSLDNKTVLYIHIPESSQVHRANGRIFDRNEEGDFDITENTDSVYNLYLKKQTTYSENKIYPYVGVNDLRSDVIMRVRKMASIQRNDHPWASMDDFSLLQSAQLYIKDFQTGKEGVSLAGVLLFGKDETILSILPHFKTDAILRRDNVDRYDDRDDIRTNLIDSYDRLIQFGEKHLNDPFYLQGDQRISLRSKILREIIGNLIIHREFTSPFPAKFIIERDVFYTENGNKPHGSGLIDFNHFAPFPKNPIIASVFRQIGWADELGSGIRNLSHYCEKYCGQNPRLIEGDIFKFILPLTKEVTPQATPHATPHVTPQAERINEVLEFCINPRSRGEIQEFLGLKDREYFRIQILTPLVKVGLLHLTSPDKPKSPKQRYYSTPRGKNP